MKIKIKVFWYVMTGRLVDSTNISEGYGAVTLGLEHEGSAMLVTVYHIIQRHTTEAVFFI